jgi:hypothetical protein
LSLTLYPPLSRRAKGFSAARHGASVTKTVKLPAGRPIYPYSVIKGGAYSASELVNALDRDPVAARHYAAFQRGSVRVVASPFTKPVYLSYRVGNTIYWTSRPVRLPPGEKLLTDGQNFARARCGNRICETPQTPVNDTEPAPEILNTPRPPVNTVEEEENWSEDRIFIPVAPAFGEVSALRPVVLSAVSPPGSDSSSPAPFWNYTPPVGVVSVPLQPPPILGLIPTAPVTPFPPDLWPPTPFFPLVPGVPEVPTLPLIPVTPNQVVPEPALPIPMILACAAFALARFRKS